MKGLLGAATVAAGSWLLGAAAVRSVSFPTAASAWVPTRLHRPPPHATRLLRSHAATAAATGDRAGAMAPDGCVISRILEHVGSGSYGTVHRVELRHGATAEQPNLAIAKRPWTLPELQEKHPSMDAKKLQEKQRRCRAYFDVEAHCLQKLGASPNLPAFRGVLTTDGADDDAASPAATDAAPQPYIWLVTDFIAASHDQPTTPAPSLADLLLIETASRRQPEESQNPPHHHLTHLAAALGLPKEASLVETLDVVLEQLLQVLVHVHAHGIVHRDLKPANVLVSSGDDGSTGRLTLIDFGSAADLEAKGGLGDLFHSLLGTNPASPSSSGNGGDTVAVSPMYAAPEVFVDASNPATAVTFDCCSLALLQCQLLFQYTDERTDAGFRQQLVAANWDLDTWLDAQLQSKVAPAGLPQALEVLRQRPGLWALLQNLLRPDPRDRMGSREALGYWGQIKRGDLKPKVDGAFLNELLESMEQCVVPTVRPLQFVATFARSTPLGLVLAEPSIDEADDADMDPAALRAWRQATSDALPGEVFIKQVVPGGQAEELGVIEIGDRLLGVGELPVGGGGFERAVALLGEQPRSSKYVTLHFDRKSALTLADPGARSSSTRGGEHVRIVDTGAWSATGRRTAQEDAFLVSEVHDDAARRSLRLAGVMDGHLGAAASGFVRTHLAQALSEELARASAAPAADLLRNAWDKVCENYRSTCDDENCSADYDAVEGTLQAFTGSENVPAGTTACLVAFDASTCQLTVLNCGDSRCVVVDPSGGLAFATTDHSPGSEQEQERLERGRRQGLPYAAPECSLSRWVVPVGDYNFALSRSLEGRFATSRGLVSTPDVTELAASAVAGASNVLLATDGFWEVIDSREAAAVLHRLRSRQRAAAAEAAKILTSLALERGSADNVSVVLLYLDAVA